MHNSHALKHDLILSGTHLRFGWDLSFQLSCYCEKNQSNHNKVSLIIDVNIYNIDHALSI